ncbi:GH116 family glycosyl-hydrolase [Paenibacillus lignilyticus]|uniref:Beta-glucosidase n=1 Tax=Paenibacillus lignilyticus TaxID=1172615 RepID=A0ABS5C7P7_9BACL|nr:hypothetical protein [Paenibacillus lignilyticus]
MNSFVYEDERLNAISFPIGGIGTGCIGLAGNGRLLDWEILNRPNKRSMNALSHFAIKAEDGERVLDARILQGELSPPYMGEPVRGGALHSGYGFGPHAGTLGGMPHFEKTVFTGTFPMADIEFQDPAFPGQVRMSAYNPFIPSNEDDSSLPAAFFTITVSNTTEQALTYTVNLSSANMMKTSPSLHRYVNDKGLRRIHMATQTEKHDNPEYGELTLATDQAEGSYQLYWYRGGWCDSLEMFWRDFTAFGPFNNREYEPDEKFRNQDMASLAASIHVPAGESRSVRFMLAWSSPFMFNHWNPEKDGKRTIWKNHYAVRFEDSLASSAYAFAEWDRLERETRLFRDALYGSTLPQAVMDAVAANLSVLKSPTCLRLEDGSFYGFEGCIEDVGCCEGSCTHVWNYAYALPYLFPQLERSMRDLDFIYNRREDGRMQFRLMLPVGRERSNFHACADGQFGGIIKLYRDWKISGDDEWLRGHWEAAKTMISFAWSDSNEDKWDANQDGVLEGRQHHTLDMELFGPNSWLNGFYLAALKAGAEIAEYLGEPETAELYRGLFERGKAYTDRELFNGEYYTQQVQLQDLSLLTRYSEGKSQSGVENAYWNAEAGEIKYQIGEGCSIDQVVAQWHANLCGLGEIFDAAQTRTALESLYRYNFKSEMRKEANPWRLYSLGDEGGLLICTWPEGRLKPAVPLTYNSETMTGFEYQAAVHMIQEGLYEEGLSIVEAIRRRYDGNRRNPWNEIECGSNYARSMASYSLLHAYSGFRYHKGQGLLGFEPKVSAGAGTGEVAGLSVENYQAFWALDGAWGTVKLGKDALEINVLYGEFALLQLQLGETLISRVQSAHLGNEELQFERSGGQLSLINGSAVLSPDRSIRVVLSKVD